MAFGASSSQRSPREHSAPRLASGHTAGSRACLKTSTSEPCFSGVAVSHCCGSADSRLVSLRDTPEKHGSSLPVNSFQTCSNGLERKQSSRVSQNQYRPHHIGEEAYSFSPERASCGNLRAISLFSAGGINLSPHQDTRAERS